MPKYTVMKLRALYEAKWGWKQRGTTPPSNLTGIDKEKRWKARARHYEADQAERDAAEERKKAAAEHRESEEFRSADTAIPVDFDDDDDDVSARLLAQQDSNRARSGPRAWRASRRTPKPLVQFPED